MIATATEGGSALFPIFYYNKEAFLAQSPQLYKEQLTMAFENVFEIAPIFRAEPSRTNRHLSEAISIDVEKAFVNYNDVMELLDGLVSFIVNKIKEKNQIELNNLGIELPDVKIPFPRYNYSDLIDKLQKSHKYIRWGDDISPKILKDIVGENFYYITDWPLSTKPFYVKPKNINADDEGDLKSNPGESEKYLPDKDQEKDGTRILSESFDLMYGTLELSSGSTRIHNKNILLDRMKKKGIELCCF